MDTDTQLHIEDNLMPNGKAKGSLAIGTVTNKRRVFGPAKAYRNAEGVLVCPPAYADGFHHNKLRE